MSWRTINLGELVENFSVKAKDHEAETSELEFCGVSNEEGITKSKYAAEDKAEDYKIIEKGCFAYNPYRVNVGSIALLEDDIVGLISPAYVVFKTKSNSIVPQLLLKYLKSAEGLRQIKLHARGTVRQALRFEDLCKIEIAIPNYEEQLEFFQKITNVEKENIVLSSELSHQLDLVKQLRQAFLREAMQGKLTAKWREENPDVEPASELLKKIKAEKEKLVKEGKLKKQKPLPRISDDDILFDVPESWKWCNFDDISETIFDMEHKMPKAVSNGGIMFLSAKDLLDDGTINYTNNVKFISKEDYEYFTRNFKPQKNDIIYSRRGANLGKARIVDTDEKYLASYSCCTIRTLNPDLRFIYYLLDSGFILQQATLNTTANSIPDLGVKKIQRFKVPLPSLKEQQFIVIKLDELMLYCDELEESIKTSQQQNEMLLQQVLREALEPMSEN